MSPQYSYLIQNIKCRDSFKNSQVYYKQGRVWLDAKDEKQVGSDISAPINQLRGSTRHLKLTHPSRVLLLTSEKTTAVIKVAPVKVRQNTIQKYLAEIDECFLAATREFHAHHDELTGVLNRHGIRESLKNILQIKPNDDEEEATKDVELSEQKTVTLFAFDIDRFKSVNDRFGHAVGDAVLTSFSERISHSVESIRNDFSVAGIFGRPGGEEFELFIIGTLTTNDRNKIAERLLASIREPIGALVGRFLKQQSANDEIAPNSYPTQITSSIGVAVRPRSEFESMEAALAELRLEADTALYRAKADGRDRVREYDAIRLSHGRVTEYHESSSLVQIDIGKKVGVSRGDVYAVFALPFSGEQNITDGNSELKVLGVYPKIESARLCVINVQSDVSTCIVLSQQSHTVPGKGALLQYVYTGSMPVVFARNPSREILAGDLSDLIQFLREGIALDSLEAVISVKRKSAPDLIVPASASVIESVIALIYLVAPPGTRVFASMSGEMYIVISRNVSHELQKVVADLESECMRIGVAIALGICVTATLPDCAALTPEALMFYSSISAKPGSSSTLRYFSESTCAKVVGAWRKQRRYQDAIIDFQWCKTFGFSTPNLSNQLGLAILESDAEARFPLAASAFAAAVADAPGEQIYRANYAMALVRMNKYEDALQQFSKIEEFVVEQNSNYQLAYAKTMLEGFRSGSGIDKREMGKILLDVVSECDKSKLLAFAFDLYMEVEAVLRTGEFDDANI